MASTLTDKQLNDRLSFLENKASKSKLTEDEELELVELEEEFYRRCDRGGDEDDISKG